jgi:hypothetical protein
MNRTDQKQLLDDVLGAGPNADQNAAALAQLLQLARGRRRRRRIQRGASVMILLAAIAISWWMQPQPQNPGAQITRNPIVSPGHGTITSYALAPDQIIRNQPLAPEQMINSGGYVQIVQTTGANFQSVSDEELLELARPNIAALVRRGPHEVELVLIELPPAHN